MEYKPWNNTKLPNHGIDNYLDNIGQGTGITKQSLGAGASVDMPKSRP